MPETREENLRRRVIQFYRNHSPTGRVAWSLQRLHNAGFVHPAAELQAMLDRLVAEGVLQRKRNGWAAKRLPRGAFLIALSAVQRRELGVAVGDRILVPGMRQRGVRTTGSAPTAAPLVRAKVIRMPRQFLARGAPDAYAFVAGTDIPQPVSTDFLAKPVP